MAQATLSCRYAAIHLVYLGIYTREEKICLQGAVFLRFRSKAWFRARDCSENEVFDSLRQPVGCLLLFVYGKCSYVHSPFSIPHSEFTASPMSRTAGMADAAGKSGSAVTAAGRVVIIVIPRNLPPLLRGITVNIAAERQMNCPLSSRQVKKERLRHEGLVPVSKGSQTL